MKIEKIIYKIEKIFPTKTAEEFDNVGLLLGNADAQCNKALVCHDVTDEIIDEALNSKCELIISYHPLIFNSLKKIHYKDRVGRIITKMIENKISLYSIHTSFDNLKNGLSFYLGKILNLKNQKKLIPKKNGLMKLTTYIPNEYLDLVLNSLHEAGAGEIGNYSNCSFSTEGEGRYLGNEKSNPKIGNKKDITKTPETLISLVFPGFRKKKIIENLINSHPYESVAYEIMNIENHNPDHGLGSIGVLSKSMTQKEFLDFLKSKLPIPIVRHSKFVKNKIKTVAVLAGSGSFAIDKILIVDAGHFETEFFIKNKLHEILKEKIPNFAFVLSKVNNNPVKYF